MKFLTRKDQSDSQIWKFNSQSTNVDLSPDMRNGRCEGSWVGFLRLLPKSHVNSLKIYQHTHHLHNNPTQL